MKLSEKAKNELTRVLDETGENANGIRIYNSQGCCGTSIQMDVASHAENGETAINIDGIDFYIENVLIETLTDVTLDHNGFGFLMNGLKKESGGCCC
ncbi:MAG: iron-sulfur cluster assembly protein [Tenuifilum sp.]|jgi:Fe-S cluster assembly iron-binding protein IscA|uniref:hypothetical protein n=1 Tax=Tenuifilum sp. TaxID=2760880 RepID=UPI0024AB8D0F|nr:hypothetical protein [Tenuifilum sp.]MDI3527587.1 iron-sulfur cluster assembly protein [Tenuifilum sp.]